MSFTRRALLIGAMQGGLMTVLAGRLAWLQVVEGHRYKTLAENNRINVKLLAPSRGLILDRYGVALVENSQNFRALVVPEQTTNLEQVLNNVAPRPHEPFARFHPGEGWRCCNGACMVWLIWSGDR